MAFPCRKSSIALAVSATLATPGAYAAAVAPSGPIIPIAASPATAEQDADIASDDNGNFVVVWDDDSAGTLDVYAQLVNADGTARGGRITANTTTGGVQQNPSVAMDSDGDFVVAWEGEYVPGGTTDVYYRRFNSTGTPTSGEVTVTSTPSSSETTVSVDLADDGRVLLAWRDPGNTNVVADVFDATDTTQTGGAFPVTGAGNNPIDPTVTFTQGGEFVVSFTQQITSDNVLFGLFASDGTAILSNQSAHGSSPLEDENAPAVEADLAGNFVIAWGNQNLDNSIEVRRFSSAGSPLTGQIKVVPTGTSPTLAPDVAVDDAGDFAVSWGVDNGDPTTPGAYVRTYAADGTPDGPAQPIRQDVQTAFDPVRVTTDANGNARVAWQEVLLNDPTTADVFAQRLDLVQRPLIVGTGSSSTGSTGLLGLLGLGLAGLGRRLFRRRRGTLGTLLAGALAVGAAAGAPTPARAATAPGVQVAGRAVQVHGPVTAVRPESTRALESGNPVYVGDHVRTGGEGSLAVLKLADGTRVTLRPNSEFRVSELRQPTADAGGLGSMVMDLLRGGLRMITGSIGHQNPDQYHLRTPVATIGVRGTEFDARLCHRGECAQDTGSAPSDQGPRPVARLARLQGVVQARGGNGATRVMTRGAPVYAGDTILTGNGAWAVLRFADESRVSLQPRTVFRVANWKYDPAAPAQGNALLRLLRGGLRVLTGLIGDKATEHYKVATPVATFGIRGTGFDLQCLGACVNPDYTGAIGSVQGDGLMVHTWEGRIYAQLDGRVTEFAAGQSGFLVNDTLPPLRLPNVPGPMRDLPAPRPDTVTAAEPEGPGDLYTHVRQGAIVVTGATGEPLVVSAGGSAVVGAGGSAGSLAETPPFMGAGDTVPTPDLAGLLGSLGAVFVGHVSLGTAYAGGTAGSGLVGDRSAFENRLQNSHPAASVVSLDSSATGARAFAGYQLLGLVGIEVGYVHFGDIGSKIDPGSDNPASVARDALDRHPLAPSGIDVSGIYNTPLDVTGRTWAFGRAGVFHWSADVKTRTPSGQTFSKSFSGTDPLVGGGVEHRLGRHLWARAEWIHYRLDPDPVNYVGAGLVWTLR